MEKTNALKRRTAEEMKTGCGGAVWTNLDVTTVIKRNDHIESCPVDEHLAYKMEKRAVLTKRSAEETKPIPAIYDEEASAASINIWLFSSL
ncbi:hypothetical protein T02_1671 [Trichinella nativa]|uniref:Uncharacterized protein n=1 Tax=Trichinella nativa TaxID=6335 RepID=A0A0V1L2D2_9BILA|nr:hypothetical protein T02_1671 [Trichinella nativa]